jgi:hypothetical protein
MTRRISALTALAIALSMFVGPAACMRRARVESQQAAAGPDYFAPAPTTVLFPMAQQPELVRAAVIRSMADRGYVAESEQPGQIIARYQRGRVDLRLQVQYQPTQATITYLGSQGLRISQAGRAPGYERWVQQLSGTIQNHVRALARRPAVYVQQPQQVYYQPQPQPAPVYYPQEQPQPVVVQAAPPTVIVQEQQPQTLVIEGSAGGASVQGTVYVSP